MLVLCSISLVPIILVVVIILKKLDSNCDSNLKKPTLDDKVQVESKKLSAKTRNALIVLVAICLNCSTGLEYTHLNFSATFYQNIPIHLTAQRAAQVLSVMSTAFTFGRIFSILASIKFKPDVMIVVHILIICLAVVVLFFGQHSETYIFIGNAMIGNYWSESLRSPSLIFSQDSVTQPYGHSSSRSPNST